MQSSWNHLASLLCYSCQGISSEVPRPHTKQWDVEEGQVFLMQYAREQRSLPLLTAPQPKSMFAHLRLALFLLQEAMSTKSQAVKTVAESLVPWLLPHSHLSLSAPLYYRLGKEANWKASMNMGYIRQTLSALLSDVLFCTNLVMRTAWGKNEEGNLQGGYSKAALSHPEPAWGLQYLSSGVMGPERALW